MLSAYSHFKSVATMSRSCLVRMPRLTAFFNWRNCTLDSIPIIMDEPNILIYGGLHQFLPTEKLGMYECRYSACPSCIGYPFAND